MWVSYINNNGHFLKLSSNCRWEVASGAKEQSLSTIIIIIAKVIVATAIFVDAKAITAIAISTLAVTRTSVQKNELTIYFRRNQVITYGTAVDRYGWQIG